LPGIRGLTEAAPAFNRSCLHRTALFFDGRLLSLRAVMKCGGIFLTHTLVQAQNGKLSWHEDITLIHMTAAADKAVAQKETDYERHIL
jgi:hypothetical protein